MGGQAGLMGETAERTRPLPLELVQLSAAMSLDGHIDGCGPAPLVLSGPEDCREVHALRARMDAILVGAGTVRRDDPRLTVRCPDLIAERCADGLAEQPAKVVLTASGDLDPQARFFTVGGARLVLCPAGRATALRDRLGGAAEVIGLPDLQARTVLTALAGCGIRRLLVEGGCSILTLFLEAGAFHRLRLAVAPFFVGGGDAPRLVGPGRFLHGPSNRLRVERTSLIGDVSVIDLVNGQAG